MREFPPTNFFVVSSHYRDAGTTSSDQFETWARGAPPIRLSGHNRNLAPETPGTAGAPGEPDAPHAGR